MSNAIVTFEPKSLDEAERLAVTLSKSLMLPEALRNKPGDVLFVMMAGRELGLAPMQALRGLNIINGKPVMTADMTVGLVLSHPELCEYFEVTETTATKATAVTKRKGREPQSLTFTIEDAQRAGLTGKDVWKKYPGAMLRARVTQMLARMVYPDVVAGIYEQGEAEEISGKTTRPPDLLATYAVGDNVMDGEVVAEPRTIELPSDASVAVEKSISTATTLDELKALIPTIRALSPIDCERAKGLYSAKVKELKAAQVAVNPVSEEVKS